MTVASVRTQEDILSDATALAQGGLQPTGWSISRLGMQHFHYNSPEIS